MITIPTLTMLKINEEVAKHLYKTKPDDNSYRLRIKHINEMESLAIKSNILDNTMYLAIRFHDVCKFESKEEHDAKGSEYLITWCIENRESDNIDIDDIAKAAMMISMHSKKKSYSVFGKDIQLLMELDVLSKFTTEYNKLYFQLLNKYEDTKISEKDFYLHRLSKLLGKVKNMKLNVNDKLILEDVYDKIIESHINKIHDLYKK